MNTASLELCKELYELSGWYQVEQYYEYYPVSKSTRLRSGYPGNILPKMLPDFITPAYDLGYLLRKLPEGKIDRIHKVTKGVWWSNKWQKWVCIRQRYGVGSDNDEWKTYEYKADTPEDAAAKLAIQLFKQNILTKGAN